MKTLYITLKIFLFFTVLTGIIYPLLITAIAQLAFHTKANGSLIVKNNKIVGSELIGQKFDSIVYFNSRPSAVAYHPLPSGGSNYGLTNQQLRKLVDLRRNQFISFNQLDTLSEIPSEMLFASASGLDPHISPGAALFQVDRIVNARHFSTSQKRRLLQSVNELTEMPQFKLLGEKRINVLLLNLRLEEIK